MLLVQVSKSPEEEGVMCNRVPIPEGTMDHHTYGAHTLWINFLLDKDDGELL